MKIVLVVYDLRESALAGSFRIREFAKYLALWGHVVEVICAFAESEYLDFGTKRVRVYVIPDRDRSKFGLLRKGITRLSSWPDPSSYWASRVIHQKDFKAAMKRTDVVLVSSPPHGIQQIGVNAAKNYGVKYFADFRDDFLTNHRIRWRTPFHRIAARKLEKEVVSIASEVILNTDEIWTRFRDRYLIHAEKLSVITNGYRDVKPPDYEKMHQLQCNQIVYIGSPYAGFAPKLISDINDELLSRGASQLWRFRTAGPGDWKCSEKYETWKHEGLVSQSRSQDLMNSAGVLLLMMPPGEREPSGTVPLKTYSYLISNRPIVYYGEKGSTTELLSKFDGVVSIERDNIMGLVDWLMTQGLQLAKKPISRYPEVEQYSFENLTKRLEILLAQRVGNFNKIK